MTKDRAQKQKGRFKCPEWRLYANFLHRELGRLWYGKKSIFTSVKGDKEKGAFWVFFGIILAKIIQKFGQAHGLTANEIDRRYKNLDKEYYKWIDSGFAFNPIIHGLVWIAQRTLGEKLAREFLYDFQIAEIIILTLCTSGYVLEGKMPPYPKEAILRPIEFYEGLPVAPELEEWFYGKNRPNPDA
jgi:hypothetical protein